ncbi:hypothetical protein [Streptomyces sp.]|nr:hypothetical protein [Streptomyces sp.]HZF91863.1 hypothetical protein [Streptomyces sp.]
MPDPPAHDTVPTGGRITPSAATTRLLERLGWVTEVRRPTPNRRAARRLA